MTDDVRCPRWVRRAPGLDAGCRLTLMALWSFASWSSDGPAVVWPTVPKLMEELGASRSTIKDWLTKLRVTRWIRRTTYTSPQGRRHPAWELAWSEPWEGTGVTSEGHRGDRSPGCPVGVTGVTAEGYRGDPDGVTGVTPEQTGNEQEPDMIEQVARARETTDFRPMCRRCGARWLPPEGIDAQVTPCPECQPASREPDQPHLVLVPEAIATKPDPVAESVSRVLDAQHAAAEAARAAHGRRSQPPHRGKVLDSIARHVRARLAEGYTEADCLRVVAVCSADWMVNPKGLDYATVTPWRPANFGRLLGQDPAGAGARASPTTRKRKPEWVDWTRPEDWEQKT